MSQSNLRISIRRFPGTEDLPLPSYQTAGSAGMDLYAAVTEPVTLAPGERTAIPTGVAVAVPMGYEAQVRARSGLARKQGVALVNAPGTVDSDYRGEVCVLIINLGQETVTIQRGERIAQMVICPVLRVEWEEVTELDETDRGAGGFGHTGTGKTLGSK
jgi:dUTP pyrophosphatase